MAEVLTTINLDYGYVPRERNWICHPAIERLRAKISLGSERYIELLRQLAQKVGPQLEDIPLREESSILPHWNNGWFEGLDAISLCGLLLANNPRRYVEIGSGNSTKFARWTIQTFSLRTRIISVDPQPRSGIDELCDEVIRERFEDVDITFAADFNNEDVLFVDNSHRSFPNSDVTVFFLETLPILPRGMVFGIHDIFLPYDYPDAWRDRFYNEQYLLACYLLGGLDGGSILLPNHYLQRTHGPILHGLFKPLSAQNVSLHGGAFWMTR